MFTAEDVIYTYTREQAIEDGVLIDANVGEFAEVTRQHYRYPVAMTAAVFALIRKAVESERHCNDYKGVWHDICWMANLASRRSAGSQVLFQVIITGTGRKRYHTLKAVCAPIGPNNPQPCVTFMLPCED